VCGTQVFVNVKEDNLSTRDRMARFYIAPKLSSSRNFNGNQIANVESVNANNYLILQNPAKAASSPSSSQPL